MRLAPAEASHNRDAIFVRITLVFNPSAGSDDQPDAAIVAALALARPVPEGPPAPFYLRDADAKLPGPLKAPPQPRARR